MRLLRGEERDRPPRAPPGASATAPRRSARLTLGAGARRIAPILCIFAAIAALRAPGLDLPFYWDETGAYVPPSLEVARRGLWTALPGCHPKGMLSGHPPVLYLLHGSLHQLFGAAIWPHRAASVVFAAIGVWSTFRLGALVGSRATGVAAAILLLASPMYFAQSTMVLGDLPIAALGAASLSFLFAGQRLAYAVTATLLVQTKETALAIAVAAAIHDFLRRRQRPATAGSVAMHAVPIGSLALFYLLEFLRTGAFVQAVAFASNSLLIFDPTKPAEAIGLIAAAAAWVGQVLFVGEGRLALAGLITLGLLAAPRALRRPEIATLALVIAFYWGAFSLIAFLPRYVMPALPCLCVLAACAAGRIARGRVALQSAIVAGAALYALPYFVSRSESGTFETNLQHERAIAITMQAAEYAEANLAEAIVIADWPFTQALRVPELGYVRSPLPRVHRARAVRAPLASLDERRRIALIHASMAPTAAMRALLEQAEAGGFRRARRFASEELVVEILVRDP